MKTAAAVVSALVFLVAGFADAQRLSKPVCCGEDGRPEPPDPTTCVCPNGYELVVRGGRVAVCVAPDKGGIVRPVDCCCADGTSPAPGPCPQTVPFK